MTDVTASALADALRSRYAFERELGHGGMAIVYLAHDLRHDRPVALKVLRPELAAALGPERFLREIRLTAQLQHPHILTVLDSGEASDRLWFTMPFIEGGSLRDVLAQEGRLGIHEAIRIARDAAEALDYAHHHGVIHRDVKPENLLLTGNRSTMVADFGLARSCAAAASDLTEAGIAVGTPIYMSPEQAGGHAHLDARTDVYSLACVLYELLAGDPPFTGVNAQAIIARKSLEPPPGLQAVRATVSGPLEDVILKALAILPADRFASAAEFSDALDRAAAAKPVRQDTRPQARLGWRRPLAGVVAAALLLGSMWLSHGDPFVWLRSGLATRGAARLSNVRPVSPAASDAYALGRVAMNKTTVLGLYEAISYFRTAIAESPTYAVAYADLAFALLQLPYYDGADPKLVFPQVTAAATRALQLDSTLANAHTALAWVAAAYDWDWAGAERHHRRALELDPSFAIGHLSYASFLSWEGRFDEAISEDLRARELEPLRVTSHLGFTYYLARRYDRAIELYGEIISQNPRYVRVRFDLGRAYYEKGMYQEAIPILEEAIKMRGRSKASAMSDGELAKALARVGRREEAVKILRELEAERERGYHPDLDIAAVYVALDDKEKAFYWLERAYQDRDPDMILIKVFPFFDPIRDDPRFKDMLRRVHFRN